MISTPAAAAVLEQLVLLIENPLPLQARNTLPVRLVPVRVKVLLTEVPTVVSKLNDAGSTVRVGTAVEVPDRETVALDAPAVETATVPVAVPADVGA